MKKAALARHLITTAIVLTGIILIYFCFIKKSTKRSLWNFIPQDAVYIIETNNISKGWNTISESKVWSQLIRNPLFNDFQEEALSLDSLIRLDKTMNKLLANKTSLISCHLTDNNSFDFLFSIDIKQAQKLAFLKTHIKSIVDFYGYKMQVEDFNNNKVLVFTDKKTNETVYAAIIDNILISSYNKTLIQKSIKASNLPDYWKENINFQKIASQTSNSSLFHFYVSHRYLSGLFSYYITDQDKLLAELKKVFNYSAFDFNFHDNHIIFNGTTILKDSTSSYLHTLSSISPGKMACYKVIPNDMALYLSLTFDNYLKFYNTLTDKMTTKDTTLAASYIKNKNSIEKMLDIDLEKDFFSFIGNEIALVKLPPSSNSKEYDAIAYIHTNDIDLAENKLTHICNQIDKKTPAKTTEQEYKGIPIHYFALNGFFKMFFGKIFARLDKPYFIYLDDFVIFSNTPNSLRKVIDNWLKRKTLEHNPDFMSFIKNFEGNSNVSAFIRGPKIYNHFYNYAQNSQKQSIKNNKEMLVSFQYIGFQLISESKGLFANKFIIQHNPDALYEEDLEQIENKAEELYINQFDSLLTQNDLGENKSLDKCCIYRNNDSTKIMAEGRLKHGKKDKIWRFYYPSGNTKGTINYNKGAADGKALLFYDTENGKTMAEAEFNNGEINGKYFEFYKNGAQKCQLEFDDNLLDGDAKYFYETGQLKIQGHYKNGLRNKKWKHYTETGELYDKTRWKKDKKK
jgi:antitoxin component YwqK of YwqJK toxin-antitoxin module